MSDIALVTCDWCMISEFVHARDKEIWASDHVHDEDDE